MGGPGRTDDGSHRRRRLIVRLGRNVFIAIVAIAVSLGGGMVLYHAAEGMDWIDAFVNVAMIVTGMGPLDSPTTNAGKIVAGCFALYSGFMLVGLWGLILAPFVQHLAHHLRPGAAEDPPTGG